MLFLAHLQFGPFTDGIIFFKLQIFHLMLCNVLEINRTMLSFDSHQLFVPFLHLWNHHSHMKLFLFLKFQGFLSLIGLDPILKLLFFLLLQLLLFQSLLQFALVVFFQLGSAFHPLNLFHLLLLRFLIL